MMWIRNYSQDILICCDNFFIDHSDEDYKIKTIISTGIYCLGKYSTKAKALKVLNIIEDELCDGNDFYQMPLDSEVEDDD